MDTTAWFDDLPVLGEFSLEEAAAALRDVGEDESADLLEATQEDVEMRSAMRDESSLVFSNRDPLQRKRMLRIWPFYDKPWQYSSHEYGYLASLAQTSNSTLPIYPVGSIPISDNQLLKNARVQITLDRLYIASYPGGDRDTHLILVHFSAKNMGIKEYEDVYFNITCQARNGEHAAIRNYPIFVGLNVGNALVFKGFTINLKNSQDEAFLKFLQSDTFKAGLQLTSTVQPVLAPFLVMAKAVAEMIYSRNHKRIVQKFALGLDFNRNITGARLAEGTYIAVQTPGPQNMLWNWDEWVYHPTVGQVVFLDDLEQPIPYNYFVFSISRYEEAGIK